jgi:predicted DNA-binding protein
MQSRRITITLTPEEYARLTQVAKATGWPIATFAADALAGAVDAELEAMASEAELTDELNRWMLGSAPTIGNA